MHSEESIAVELLPIASTAAARATTSTFLLHPVIPTHFTALCISNFVSLLLQALLPSPFFLSGIADRYSRLCLPSPRQGVCRANNSQSPRSLGASRTFFTHPNLMYFSFALFLRLENCVPLKCTSQTFPNTCQIFFQYEYTLSILKG